MPCEERKNSLQSIFGVSLITRNGTGKSHKPLRCEIEKIGKSSFGGSCQPCRAGAEGLLKFR
jgi:hypothetical protein